jgi:hypothetical protein
MSQQAMWALGASAEQVGGRPSEDRAERFGGISDGRGGGRGLPFAMLRGERRDGRGPVARERGAR